MGMVGPFWGVVRRQLAAVPVELLLFLVALAIRLFRISSDPLWLDEYVIPAIGLGGVGAFFQFSTLTPHPPLYYLLQWAAAGFGSSNSEFAWRWLPALCGAITVPLLYRLARLVASPPNALIVALLALVLPSHLFFSQEARPYAFVMLLATLNTLTLAWAQRIQTRRAYALVVLLWLIGLGSSYTYSAIIIPQLLWLLLHRPISARLIALIAGMAVIGGVAVVIAYQPMLAIARRAEASGVVLDFAGLVDYIFLLDPVRYGRLWSHAVAPALSLLLIGLGAWYGIAVRRLSLVRLYLLQLLLPLVGVFLVLSGLLGIQMPVKDAKQFMILLPSAWGLLALGFEALRAIRRPWLARLGLALATLALLLAYAEGLGRYWTTTKSPEGQVVKLLMQHQAAGDAVVIAQYSLSAAFSFYQPETAYYSQHAQCGGAELFAYNRFAGLASGLPACTHDLSAIIDAHSRIWLLNLEQPPVDLGPIFDARCSQQATYAWRPFQALLYVCSAAR